MEDRFLWAQALSGFVASKDCFIFFIAHIRRDIVWYGGEAEQLLVRILLLYFRRHRLEDPSIFSGQ